MTAPSVAVLDHGMGNLRSVAKALEAAGARVDVTAERDAILGHAGLCVPGQGIFGRCLENMSAGATDDVVRSWIASGRPYLGICLGMQILFDESEERGPVKGLGVLHGTVEKLPGEVPIPHIGWNTVERGAEREYYYFDHSYAVRPADHSIVEGWCEHGAVFAAQIRAGNVVAVQFHPEKSSRAGVALLEDWVRSL